MGECEVKDYTALEAVRDLALVAIIYMCAVLLNYALEAERGHTDTECGCTLECLDGAP